MKVLISILILASILRFYGLNWDQSQHFHPDERMITMVALKIQAPTTPEEWQNLLTPQSTLNPKFFAYGSLPLYLLKISGSLAANFRPVFDTYDGLNLVGRFLSVLFDLGIIVILYLLGKKLINRNVGLLAAFFYTLSVLPIQLAHFYAVDTPLTFFILATLYSLINFLDKPTLKNILLSGIFFGLALATKTSALVLAMPFLSTFLMKTFFQKHSHSFSQNTYYLILTTFTIFITFLIFEPFALIDFSTFWKQTLEQQQMTKDAFTFPYTLQYVGKISYWYELKNIFFWGLGPILASLSFIGTIFFTYRSFRPILNSAFLILNSFFWIYFLVVGHFAIGFMRYMLPIYPLLILFAAILVHQIFSLLKPRLGITKFLILNFAFCILLSLWPLSFITIYSHPNTRTQASNWIYQNISPISVIALEHWDDALPTGQPILYPTLLLPLYDPETPAKWQQINQILNTTDYIIIASNRLYTPLQKLTDCSKLPANRCYPQTAEYYQKLFQGELGFTKVAEFTTLPSLSIGDRRLAIDDSFADESFTVYDHPKIMIFKKISLPFAKVMIN